MEYTDSPAVTERIEVDSGYSSSVSEFVRNYTGTANSWALDRLRPTRNDAVTTETVSVLDTAHPWYAAGLKQIDALSELGDDWHEVGAEPPNPIAVAFSKLVLEKLSDIGFRPSRIDPSSAGGICISFESDEKYADVECLNSGNIIALTMNGDDNPNVWDLVPLRISDAVADIDGFIRR